MLDRAILRLSILLFVACLALLPPVFTGRSLISWLDPEGGVEDFSEQESLFEAIAADDLRDAPRDIPEPAAPAFNEPYWWEVPADPESSEGPS